MYETEFCYSGGYLDQALYMASEFIRKIGEDKVLIIASENDESLGWTIFVVYEKDSKQ